jgi:dTMP kinase
VVVLLDVPPSVAADRLRGRDRMEAEGDEFHRRVADGYRELAAADPDRWIIIDGTGAVDEVAERVREAFDKWATVQS